MSESGSAQIIPFARPAEELLVTERVFEDRLRDALRAALRRIDADPVGGIFLVVLDEHGMTLQRDNIVQQPRQL